SIRTSSDIERFIPIKHTLYLPQDSLIRKMNFPTTTLRIVLAAPTAAIAHGPSTLSVLPPTNSRYTATASQYFRLRRTPPPLSTLHAHFLRFPQLIPATLPLLAQYLRLRRTPPPLSTLQAHILCFHQLTPATLPLLAQYLRLRR